ncbi:hypothetical protein [Trinickia fusca]|nr:hypothetical protein [Trinickia fusca]
MLHDLVGSLRVVYEQARDRHDRHAMDVAAQAISYAVSGHRELALDAIARSGLIMESTDGHA